MGNLKERHVRRMQLLAEALKLGMAAAKERPGRYGGRYVAEQARKATKSLFTPHDPPQFVVLDDDDPDVYQKRVDLDILAQCTKTKCYGIGRARYYIKDDGTVRE